MSDVMKGGGWEGGGETDAIDRGLLEFLKEASKNGIVVDGIIAWIDIQQDRSADQLWKARALDRYCDEEVSAAKVALWKASEKNIGYAAPARQGDNKTKADIEDIENALTKLKLANAKPTVLATSKMISRTPNFCGVSGNSDVNDVAQKVKNMENSMNAFMKQNADQMKVLNEAVGLLGKNPNAPINEHVARLVRSNAGTESPGKRKRTEDDVIEETVAKENMYASVAARNTVQRPPSHTGTIGGNGNNGNVNGIRPMTPRTRKPYTYVWQCQNRE